MTAHQRKRLHKALALAVFILIVGLCFAVMFGSGTRNAAAAVSASGKWTCSMCPQFILPEPGKCPKCFMDLIPLEEGAGSGTRLELYLTPGQVELAGIVAEPVEPDGPRDGDLSLPASAVLTSRGRNFVFVESLEDEHIVYTLREIATPGRKNGRYAVASGLDEGEMVAVAGAFRIDSAMQILGKTSLANLPDGELSAADGADLPPYQPAERSAVDIRAEVPGVDDWFRRYEQVRAALAKDADRASGQPARELADLLGRAKAPASDGLAPLLTRLASSSRELAAAGDLTAKRSAFESVTADMVLLARRYGSPEGGLNLVFCPMAFGGAGAYWLQPGDTVDNPYHGLEMPLCGWMVDAVTPPSNQE